MDLSWAVGGRNDVPMVLVRKAVAADWEALRDIRLAALRDAPDAFGSTYAEQAAFTREQWLARIAGNSTFLAYLDGSDGLDGSETGEAGDAGEAVGLAGGYQETPAVAELVSMWVRPQARGLRIGEALIDAVADWARTSTTADSPAPVGHREQQARPSSLRTMRLHRHRRASAAAIQPSTGRVRHVPSALTRQPARTPPVRRATAPAAVR